MPRFKDSQTNAAWETEREGRRNAMERVDQLEENINAFIASVMDVTFNVDEADAQGWMSNWQANLLSGVIGPDKVPEPVDAPETSEA